ncbi:minichromosome maintenance domain-containing protein 2-like [Neocloeon triangulifer]|uniref:minichromosome maintenance domain-containing protein 2-like n=1 Tax=Neocloeon triangulifer TaxID=2078957 RepID=UPI00286ED223|nr:minichromosome maintenance domain-containing protein 2-like [Neocloeon triangulifer]
MADVSDEGNVNLANYILNKSQTHQEVCIEDYLTDTDLKLLISNLGTRKVTVTERAGNLIRNYFVASRRARVNGGSTIEQCLPIGAVQSMTTMAEAHARLSLRSEVLAEDALVAIALYEQSMVTLYGPAFQAPPPSYFDTSLSYENVQQSVDDYMTTVMAWAQNYIKSLIGIEE